MKSLKTTDFEGENFKHFEEDLTNKQNFQYLFLIPLKNMFEHK